MLAVTPLGDLTLRCASAEYPPEGTPVGDATGRIRGRISRVFGPTAQPYLTVRLRRPPSPQEGAALVGAPMREETGSYHGT